MSNVSFFNEIISRKNHELLKTGYIQLLILCSSIFTIFIVATNKLFKFSHPSQLINDLSDYSSVYDNNVKSYQDAFSDIRNGIITQPTYELIDSDLINEALGDPTIIDDTSRRESVIDLLIKNGVRKKVIEITKEGYNQNINFWKEIMKLDSDFLFYTY